MYLEGNPDMHQQLVGQMERNARVFLDQSAAPSIAVVQARVLHALQGEADGNCLLPMLRTANKAAVMLSAASLI